MNHRIPTLLLAALALTAGLALNPAAASEAATAAVENPYGLDALWKGGDFVTKGTLGILVIMSLGSWYILITKFLEQSRVYKQARAADNAFVSAVTVREAIDALEDGSPFHYITHATADATANHRGLFGHIDLNTWVTQAIQLAIESIQSRLQGGLAFLATVGSTAPFVGLFGTVWGIYHALTAIGIAGQASIDKVAGPVGEALIMTAIGLAVAVPAVLGYNWLVRRNKAALEKVRAFGVRLHGVVLGDESNAQIQLPVRRDTARKVVNVAFSN
ncbi:MAG: MotA/TolQ/ExbB proton channel family protein [Rhodocyclaceae bacterium]